MNRKQRREEAKKNGIKNKPIAFKPPVASIPYKDVHKVVEKEIDEIRLEAANRSLNMYMGGSVVTLIEQYGWSLEEVEQFIERVINKLEAVCASRLQFEEFMNLCGSYGMKLDKINWEKVEKDAQTTLRIIDLYGEMKEVSTKTDVFSLLNKGETDCAKIASELSVSKKTVETYKTAWNKMQKKNEQTKDLSEMNPAEFADKLFENEVEVTTSEQKNKELQADAKEIAKSKIMKEEKEAPVMEERKVLAVPAKERKFEVKRTVEIEAEFGTYTIQNQVADVKLATREMGLTKTDLIAFAEELQAVAAEM